MRAASHHHHTSERHGSRCIGNVREQASHLCASSRASTSASVVELTEVTGRRRPILYRVNGTNWVPVEGKSSVCVICMEYRIIVLIIIIISLGEISLSYIANTTRTHTQTPTHRRSGCRCSMAPNHDGVNAHFRRFRWRSMAGRCFIQINIRVATRYSR